MNPLFDRTWTNTYITSVKGHQYYKRTRRFLYTGDLGIFFYLKGRDKNKSINFTLL